MAPPPVARNKIREYGIDAVIERLGKGETQTEIANEIGVSVMSLNRELHADEITSARVLQAQLASAELFELQAIQILAEAQQQIRDDPGISGSIVALARERSQACWRQASIRDRSRYSDTRTQHVNVTVRTDASQLSTAELEQIALQGKTLQLDNDTGEVSDH
jgi:transcriptional regulator with XRE-family HTH domain